MSWLDEGIRRSDESGGDDDDDGDGGDDVSGNSGDGGDDDSGYGGYGGDDEETHGVGGSQRGGTMTWDSKYYVTQDIDHGGRAGISQGIWISWFIWILVMIIRVNKITTHMVIIVLKAIYRGWV